MIIDEILDRKAGRPYNAKAFYNYCMDYFDGLGDTIGDVQEALCGYILQQDYNPEICDYVRSVNWIEDDKLNPMCENCKARTHADDQGRICWGTTEQVWTGCAHRRI